MEWRVRTAFEAARKELVWCLFSETSFRPYLYCCFVLVTGPQNSARRFVPQFAKSRKTVTRPAELREEDLRSRIPKIRQVSPLDTQ